MPPQRRPHQPAPAAHDDRRVRRTGERPGRPRSSTSATRAATILHAQAQPARPLLRLLRPGRPPAQRRPRARHRDVGARLRPVAPVRPARHPVRTGGRAAGDHPALCRRTGRDLAWAVDRVRPPGRLERAAAPPARPRPHRAGLPRRRALARAAGRPGELGADRHAHPGAHGLRGRAGLRLRLVGRRAQRPARLLRLGVRRPAARGAPARARGRGDRHDQQDPTNLVRGFFAAELTSLVDQTILPAVLEASLSPSR